MISEVAYPDMLLHVAMIKELFHPSNVTPVEIPVISTQTEAKRSPH